MDVPEYNSCKNAVRLYTRGKEMLGGYFPITLISSKNASSFRAPTLPP